MTERTGTIKFVSNSTPQKEWGWQVAVYLYLAGMGAGAFVIGLLMDWLGYAMYYPRALMLWGPVLVAIGAPFLILKLGKQKRFWKAALNPRTSWLARGFHILLFFIIVGGVALAAAVLPVGWLERWSEVILSLEVLSIILALAVAVYTGILIQSVKYVPFWNTWLLPLLFTVSALSTGAMAIILSALGYGLVVPSPVAHSQLIDIVIRIEQIMVLIEAIVLFLYLYFRYRAQDQGQNSVRQLLSGRLRYIFWIGIVASGLLFPVILEGIYSSLPDYPVLLVFSGLFLLTGGYCLRYGIIAAGIKELHPLQNIHELDYIQASLKPTPVPQ